MKRKLVSFALVSCFAGLLGVAPASADDAHLVAYLSGANERPNAAPAENIGRAVVTINDAANQLCVAIQVTGVALPATGYHIHLGAANAAGPVVVPFAAPTGSQNYQCVTSENEALLDNIAANPGQYYVNIHNAAYPGGAARGQLQAF
jgi:hypothetical protein